METKFFYIYEPQKIKLVGEEIRTCKTCFINEHQKICLINIPKNASTSLKSSLSLKVTYYDNKKYKDYKKIIVLRNPMSRIISSYNEVMKLRKETKHITSVTKFYQNRGNIKKSFNLFLDYIKNNFYDIHTVPQYLFLKQKGLSIKDIDDIILLDDIDNGLKKIMLKYGLKNKRIPQSNIGNKKIKTTLEKCIYNYEQKIYNMYYKDFEMYYDIDFDISTKHMKETIGMLDKKQK